MPSPSQSSPVASTASEAPVVIVGGTGLVGRTVSELLRARHPRLPLLIAGRNHARAAAVASRLPHAEPAVVDVQTPAPLASLGRPVRAILGAVNDPAHRLLLSAARAGIPLVDVTRWTSRLEDALVHLAVLRSQTPVLLASGWMAGLAPLVAAAAAQRLREQHGEAVSRIDIGVMYDLADRAGPDSVEFMDRLAIPFEVTERGNRRTVDPLSEGAVLRFPGGRHARAFRIDTPEQLTLPASTGAHTVSTRIAFSSAASTLALVALGRLGVLWLLRHDRFQSFRRRLLHVNGPGGRAAFVVEARGERGAVRAEVTDDLGQAHLTAIGAVVALERALGLDGAPPPEGVAFPEASPVLDRALDTARSLGATITFQPGVAPAGLS